MNNALRTGRRRLLGGLHPDIRYEKSTGRYCKITTNQLQVRNGFVR